MSWLQKHGMLILDSSISPYDIANQVIAHVTNIVFLARPGLNVPYGLFCFALDCGNSYPIPSPCFDK